MVDGLIEATNVVVPRRRVTRSASNAAPIAPASRSAGGGRPRRSGRASRCSRPAPLSAAMFFCVPPWSTNTATELRHARDLDDVLQMFFAARARAREQLLLGVPSFLEVHANRSRGTRRAIAELRREDAPRTRPPAYCFTGDAELIGHRLQQHAVAGEQLFDRRSLDVAVSA